MPQSTLEMAKDLVLAQIQSGMLSPEGMQEALGRIHQNLMSLKNREASGLPGSAPGRAPADWRQSITQHAITCLECGAQFRQLTGRHLGLHGLDARSYRGKFGIPQSQPLAARETAAKRRQITAEVRPWEKSPTYRKGQEAKAAAKKSGRKKATRKG
jgi:predicted transcriptional regulator